MAYAAVTSLKQTIRRLLNSSRISIVSPSLEIIKSAYNEVDFLQGVVERLDSSSSKGERVNALDGRIREAVFELEDVLESHVTYQFISQSESLGGESRHPLSFTLDLLEVTKVFDSFIEKIKKIQAECNEEHLELGDPLPEEEKEDDVVSTRIDFCIKKSRMVGLSDQFERIISKLIDERSRRLNVLSLVGMAGIGKTTLAIEAFRVLLDFCWFECSAFVAVGPNCQLKKIMRSILTQVNSNTEEMLMDGDEELSNCLYKSLEDRKYLIVLDDVWDTRVLHDLKMSLPEDNNASRVLMTTRLQEGTKFVEDMYEDFQIRFLSKEESWDLLREKVFGDESCPHKLEKVGKKIAENCYGLPLTIVSVADILCKAEKTEEYWKDVAELKNSVFQDAHDQMSKVLFPSYENLPQYLKACFLYMAIFPQNYEIPTSKLFMLWTVEEILEPNSSQTLEDLATDCLEELASKSLVLIHYKKCSFQIKSCSIHSAFWHLCAREARKIKFLHILNSYADGLAESIKKQRRLCIQNSILFGVKDVYNSIASISTARSLLCSGSPHQYPVPMCTSLRLLRVLDAVTILLYEFPLGVLELVQLRYLALTCNGKLPASICKLWNLEFLIILRRLSMKCSVDKLYLPIEIWDMKELKHLQIMESTLPNPAGGALLPNLSTLLHVSALSCTEGVLKTFPNLKKLGIQIELTTDDVRSLPCLNHISCLHKLESLKCVISNPMLMAEVIAPPAPPSMFPSGLRKLTLSGLGYPWEHMRTISSLPNLQVLKLRHYAFRGPKWETHAGEFEQLVYMLLEDTDLVYWKVDDRCFPTLNHLTIRHCYKLKVFPASSALKTELVDCNPSASNIVSDDNMKMGFANVHSSWDGGN